MKRGTHVEYVYQVLNEDNDEERNPLLRNENSTVMKSWTHYWVGTVNQVMRTQMKRGTHSWVCIPSNNEDNNEEREPQLRNENSTVMKSLTPHCWVGTVNQVMRTLMKRGTHNWVYISSIKEDGKEMRNTLLSMYIKYIMRTIMKRGIHCRVYISGT